MEQAVWFWEVARDADEVHSLLCASDAHQALPGMSVPQRNPATTQRHIHNHNVHAIRHTTTLVGCFTLTAQPPYGMDLSVFGDTGLAAYLQRLSIHPKWIAQNPLLGMRCVRHAAVVARQRAAASLRAEINPDIGGTHKMMRMLGFQQRGEVSGQAGRRKLCLELPL